MFTKPLTLKTLLILVSCGIAAYFILYRLAERVEGRNNKARCAAKEAGKDPATAETTFNKYNDILQFIGLPKAGAPAGVIC